MKVYENVCETQDSSSALLDLSNDTPISENGHNWLQLLTHVQKFDFWVHCGGVAPLGIQPVHYERQEKQAQQHFQYTKLT